MSVNLSRVGATNGIPFRAADATEGLMALLPLLLAGSNLRPIASRPERKSHAQRHARPPQSAPEPSLRCPKVCTLLDHRPDRSARVF